MILTQLNYNALCMSTGPRFLLQLIIILLINKVLSYVVGYFKQPPVVGEIITGIIVGPSVLGQSAKWLNHVYPASSYTEMTTVANMGIVLFVFQTAVVLDVNYIKRQFVRSSAISITCIAIPFAVGIAASEWLWHINAETYPNIDRLGFRLFVGSCFCFTAAPILTSLLSVTGVITRPAGLQAISCALFDDVIAFIMIAVSAAFVKSSSMTGFYVFLTVIAYCIMSTLFFGPIVNHIFDKYYRGHPERFPQFTWIMLMVLFFLSFSAEMVGVGAFLGAFFAGLIAPKDGEWNKSVPPQLILITKEVLLPIFFANNGLKTNIGLINTGELIGMTFTVFLLASLSKSVPATLVTKLVTGQSWKYAATVGACMNTKGMVELIALNQGLTLKVISPKIFTMLVIMALLTTFTTSPVVWFLYNVLPDNEAETTATAIEAPEKEPKSSEIALTVTVPNSPTSASTAEFVALSSPSSGETESQIATAHHSPQVAVDVTP